MRDNNIRKLPVSNKKNQIIGIIFQATIANAIRDATATPPRLLSPPIKAILGNLGFVLQFAGVLLLVPAIVATVLAETEIATGIYLNTVLLLVTGFFLNSYGEKASLNLQQASVLVFLSLFLLTLFGTTPYLYISTPDLAPTEAFSNAFFSSAAGFTTGGISLFDEPENLPQSFTFYRSFTQLVGGMSFIYLVITAFYPESKLRSMRGFISGRTLHMRELFGTITVIFALYIVIVALLLWVFGERNLMDNFSLAMSTLATGGFLPNSTILQDLLWQEEWCLAIYIPLWICQKKIPLTKTRKRSVSVFCNTNYCNAFVYGN
jgi:trk system potassium uptake protein TrkH